MIDPIDAAVRLVQSGFSFFQTLAPGGFGLILIPLAALGIVSILASRKSSYRG